MSGRFPRLETRRTGSETVQLEPLLPHEASGPERDLELEMDPEMEPELNVFENASAREYDRFSTVAMEMLKEREDCDLHPYGRGGRFEGFLYDARRVKVSLDPSKLIAWILFFFGVLFVCGSIIYLAVAELDRQRNLLELSRHNKTVARFIAAPRDGT